MYQVYSLPNIVLRRAFVVLAGVVSFPFVLVTGNRSKFYSFLHRMWVKTSTKPVWLKQSEKSGRELF
ncbi:DUF2517 family protein [Thaumasiovibrio subtropicus]|uniref:DUF2517 family protein n=1 Tax=Thaumasiovibrio subtropicus TaxID=1891207 RepID=UPI000B353A38|nr:DUF2517 family protein [Thaumasiovibrio subtropicus]